MHPNINTKELHELAERIGKLDLTEQVYLIELIAAGLRKTQLTDHEALAKDFAEFADEWIAQGGEKYPYPVPAEHAPPETHASR